MTAFAYVVIHDRYINTSDKSKVEKLASAAGETKLLTALGEEMLHVFVHAEKLSIINNFIRSAEADGYTLEHGAILVPDDERTFLVEIVGPYELTDTLSVEGFEGAGFKNVKFAPGEGYSYLLFATHESQEDASGYFSQLTEQGLEVLY